MGWATSDDLLLGDTQFPLDERQRHLRDAENEMLVHLTRYYQMPLPDEDSLPDHVNYLLKHVHARLATGSIIMAMATKGGDESLSPYGQRMIEEARMDLRRFGTQTVIPGATPAVNNVDGEVDNDRRGSITQLDSASPFEAFADYTSNQGTTAWEPYK